VAVGGKQQQQQQQRQRHMKNQDCRPLADLMLQVAPRLLPLTNLSMLGTAALLDASPGISPGQARDLVRLHQKLYCR
jgi:hypothetical protein